MSPIFANTLGGVSTCEGMDLSLKWTVTFVDSVNESMFVALTEQVSSDKRKHLFMADCTV